jgi:predicted nucleic-acid-binding Zn-ribbon protein
MKKAVVGAGLGLCPKSGNTRRVEREIKLGGGERDIRNLLTSSLSRNKQFEQ